MSEETYYVRPAFNGGCPRVYHTDPECLHVTERSREINKENVKRRDLTECKVCAGEQDTSRKDQYLSLRARIEMGEVEV